MCIYSCPNRALFQIPFAASQASRLLLRWLSKESNSPINMRVLILSVIGFIAICQAMPICQSLEPGGCGNSPYLQPSSGVQPSSGGVIECSDSDDSDCLTNPNYDGRTRIPYSPSQNRPEPLKARTPPFQLSPVSDTDNEPRNSASPSDLPKSKRDVPPGTDNPREFGGPPMTSKRDVPPGTDNSRTVGAPPTAGKRHLEPRCALGVWPEPDDGEQDPDDPILIPSISCHPKASG